jgi:hypothetical protein
MNFGFRKNSKRLSALQARRRSVPHPVAQMSRAAKRGLEANKRLRKSFFVTTEVILEMLILTMP